MKHAGLFVTLALFWGGSFIAIERVITFFPPFMGAALRCLSAVAFLVVLYPALGFKFGVGRKYQVLSMVGGLCAQGIPFSLLFWGEQKISPALAGVFNGTVPIWTFVFGIALGRETLEGKKALGIGLGFLGMVLIFGPKISASGTSGNLDELLGALAVLMMAVVYGAGTLINRRLAQEGVDPMANLFQQCLISSIYLMVISLSFEKLPWFRMEMISPLAVGSVLYLGVFSTAIAFMIYFKLIKDWGALRASTVTYLVPIMAIMLDIVINHRVPKAYEWVGAGTILLGVIMLQAQKIAVPPPFRHQTYKPA